MRLRLNAMLLPCVLTGALPACGWILGDAFDVKLMGDAGTPGNSSGGEPSPGSGGTDVDGGGVPNGGGSMSRGGGESRGGSGGTLLVGGASGSPGGDAAGECRPNPAACAGKCGQVLDCGQTVDCGGCPDGLTCGGSGTPNSCGAGVCTPSCAQKVCGENDGCDGLCTQGICGQGLHCTSPGVCVCDATSCSGCCKDNACKPGDEESACGHGGAACTVCSGGATCGTGNCGTCGGKDQPCCSGATPCASPLTCGGGGQSGQCGCTPNCKDSVCGTPDGCGGLCNTGPCPTGLHCSSAGACVCDQTSCSGCCASTTACVDGKSPDACGAGGGVCSKCSATEVCNVVGGCGAPGCSNSISLHYRSDGCSGVLRTDIDMRFQVVNTSQCAIDLSQIEVRYYFTSDGIDPSSLEYDCDADELVNPVVQQCSQLLHELVPLSPAKPTADAYLRLRRQSGSLPAGESWALHGRVHKAGYPSVLKESNDYSCDTTYTGSDVEEWHNITVYLGGVLIWGTPP